MIQFTVKPANGHELSYRQRVHDERCPVEVDQSQQKLPALEEKQKATRQTILNRKQFVRRKIANSYRRYVNESDAKIKHGDADSRLPRSHRRKLVSDRRHCARNHRDVRTNTKNEQHEEEQYREELQTERT